MTSITEYRLPFKTAQGFEFPEYYERYKNATGSFWRVQGVNMNKDTQEWFHVLNDYERLVIGGILKAFTQLECNIGCYWGDYIPKNFPKHEIVAMARMFSANEIIHAEAYNHSSDTFGINEFEAFVGDPIAMKKLDFYVQHENPKISIAIFSGAAEGVSLFSSFAILLSFAKRGILKGLSEIISWSILDEQAHSDAGCSLFRQLVREQGITKEEINKIYKGFKAAIDNEFVFLENALKGGEINGLNLKIMKHFIYHRANNRLRELGIYTPNEINFKYDPKESYKVTEWFDLISQGITSHDFFAYSKEGSSYVAKPSQDWDSIKYQELELAFSE